MKCVLKSITHKKKAKSLNTKHATIKSLLLHNLNLNDYTIGNCLMFLNLCKKHKLTWDTIPELHRDLKNTLLQKYPYFNNKNTAAILAGLSALGFPNFKKSQLSFFIKKVEDSKFKDFSTENLATTLHALAKLDGLNENIINNACQKLNTSPAKLTSTNCLQIHTAFTHYCLKSRQKWQQLKSRVSPNLLQQIILSSTHALQTSTNSSSFQQEVYDLLSQNSQLIIIEEAIIECMIVDMYLPKHEVVIEVNGPHHFLPNGNLDIRSVHKQKLLMKLGYKVINIDYLAWRALSNNLDKKSFIKGLLQQHLEIKPTANFTPLYSRRKLAIWPKQTDQSKINSLTIKKLKIS